MSLSRTLAFGIALLSVLPAVLASPAAAAIDSTTIAVLINDDDADSRAIGEYYAAARHVPAQHIFHVRLPLRSTLSEEEFRALRLELAGKLPGSIQAIAATWLEPHRVDCMSMTSALAFGFDRRYCADGCALTQPSPLYASTTNSPYAQLGVRPAMLVAAGSAMATKVMIDRGIGARVAADDAPAYLVTSGDPYRDIRGYAFRRLEEAPPPRVRVLPIRGFSALGSKPMFYFTGAVRVPGVAQFAFEPGAIADHVTSAGAIFEQTDQMTVLEWLRAGAAGSYGAVVEPCNFPDKFPNPDIVVRQYAAGAPLIEAYWKSVRMPGQGLFVGEPLARPFASDRP
jgi:uncharacterized protein (TIGR03790 family)